MNSGFDTRFSYPAWGYPREEQLHALERFVNDLWELLDAQHTCFEDMSDIVHEIQNAVRALIER